MNNQRIVFLLLLLLAVVIVGCQALEDWLPCNQTGTVGGRITDQRSYGDGDVTVLLDGTRSDTTSHDGYYAFNGVAKGDHEIALGNPLPVDITGNDIQQKKTVKVGCGGQVTADFQLTYYHNPTSTDKAVADLDFKINGILVIALIIFVGVIAVSLLL